MDSETQGQQLMSWNTTDTGGRAQRRTWWIRAAILVAGGWVVMWANSPSPVSIDEAFFHPESESLIEAGVDSCRGELSVQREETGDAVRVLVEDHRFRIRFYSLTCQDSVQIELDHPLGDRSLKDEATGRYLEIQSQT